MLSSNIVDLWVKTPLSEALEYAERFGLAGGKCGGPSVAQLLAQEPPVQDGQLLPHLQKRHGKGQANSMDCALQRHCTENSKLMFPRK